LGGISRFAQVYEAMGDRVKAAEYYRKSAEFAAANKGFDQEVVDMYLEDAERMESGGVRFSSILWINVIFSVFHR